MEKKNDMKMRNKNDIKIKWENKMIKNKKIKWYKDEKKQTNVYTKNHFVLNQNMHYIV